MNSNDGLLIKVVLSETVFPRNLGMCARAIENMGFNHLIAIAPQFSLQDAEAKQGAAQAQSILQQAKVYASFEEFLNSEEDGLLVAFSGKNIRSRESIDPWQLSEKIKKWKLRENQKKPLYFLFGTEGDGLSTQELERCHHICKLPAYSENTSFNLSHACLLALAHFRNTVSADNIIEANSELSHPSQAFYFPQESIREWLITLGFSLQDRKMSAEKVLIRLLLENQPNEDELRVLDKVIRQTTRKLKGLA